MKLLNLVFWTFISTGLPAQSNAEYGSPDKSIPELAQFQYYLGTWEVAMEMRQADGSFQKIPTKMGFEARFLDDHRTLQTQFTTANGFFSTDLRTYNLETGKWEALFLNAKAQRWHQFTSYLLEDKMTTFVKGGYSGKEDFDVKVVDTVISETYFQKEVYHSRDNMKTWTLMYKSHVRKKNS